MNKEKLSRPFHQPGATPYYDDKGRLDSFDVDSHFGRLNIKLVDATEIAIQILEATQKEGCMGGRTSDRLEKLLGGE